ncbi:ComF family protein [Corynebacterium sp. NML130628]|uniref:ComF family protein n=1 Tax=Corynebacterium sp. NML130628 TaxID=1906333 RepID=UPI0008FB7E65|nr:ComF family protein [Corynebacterium sp. NML130628]OIR40200.1 phosphoribosyltransferase [Corynebacterium sp. NML130628]
MTLAEVGELFLPRHCAGCGAPGSVLCQTCRTELAAVPRRVSPQHLPHVSVFALGPYGGAHRGVVLAMKERKNLAVRKHVGAVLDAALAFLEVRGEIQPDALLVPAPTRPASARERGGDPVSVICKRTGRKAADLLELAESTTDQSELDAAHRRANLAGAVRMRRGWEAFQAAPGAGPVIVVDDVVTTGATLQTSVEVLLAHGFDVVSCIAVCAA